MLIPKNLIIEAKEKLGEEAAHIIQQDLDLQEWDNEKLRSLCPLRDSRHDKRKSEAEGKAIWIRSTYPNVHFAYKANEKIDELVSAIDNSDKFESGDSKGVAIILKSMSWTNEPYENKDKVKVYPNQHTVWDWEFAETAPSNDNSKEVVVSSDEELPF